MWEQQTLTLRPRGPGVHLIGDEIEACVTRLGECRVGLLNLFLQHTSASLAVNENADPDVRGDLQRHLETLAPRNAPHYQHTLEGPDDMPAHIKSVLIGASLSLPVSDGRLALGTWQGIYLCEHRDRAGARRIVLTLQGEA
ncbi:MAG: secondary thiamine-phosphate synthase enzyme YjbQ [Halieaceae bacterium]|nr:secondary thiamine-phosphate synthase enzyme YjbQ [Halieaceae bacterium]